MGVGDVLAALSRLSFDDHFVKIFYHWGLIAHRIRAILLIAPFLLTGFLMIGFVWIKDQTTIDPQYVFSPENARWRYERAVLTENWPLNEFKFWPGKSYDFPGYVDIIAAAKEDPEFGRPNMLVSKYINELDRINRFIIHNLSVPIEHNGKHYDVTYTDLCMNYDWKCYLNDHVIILQPKSHWGTFHGQLAELATEIIEKEIKITYPIGWRGTEPLYFGSLVGDVHLSDEEGHFDYVRAVRLTYNTRDGIIGNVSYTWRKKVADYLTNRENPPSQLLEFGMYHNESLPEGLQDVADSLTPKFVMMSLILLTFTLGCSIVLLKHDDRYIGVDWLRSKPILGVAALVCPFLATGSAFGIVLWTGEFYNAIVNISPFIVVVIGIDDAFLMSAAWHRTNPELSVATRLAETLAEAAVAISITSYTDMLTFGLGVFTTLPGVRLFCLYTFWGITFTYLYQITYFTAVMAYAGEMEDKGLNSLLGRKCISIEEADTPVKKWLFAGAENRAELRKRAIATCDGEKSTLPTKDSHSDGEETNPGIAAKLTKLALSLGTKQDETDLTSDSHHCRETFVNWFFREFYGPMLFRDRSKFFVLLIYLVYIFVAMFGCAQIEEGLNPKNLVRRSFYLTDFYVLIDQTFWEEGLQMQVVVNKPPDLFNVTQRADFEGMLAEFEGTHYTMQHNATMLWISAFEAKLAEDEQFLNISQPHSSSEYYQRAREWLISAGGRRLWELDLVWGSNRSDSPDYARLKAFRFQLGLRNYKTPTDHTNSCKLMRAIGDRYPQFNVSTFHEYYPFADQYLELKPALFSNCFLAVVCIMGVSVLMIPNYSAAFAIIAAILSIDMGVLGYMSLWGVNLESVSCITVIMSIGFSVDLSAHITYAYVKSSGSSTAKAIAALETLGWPVFLGAFTTIVGIMVLVLVDAYIVQIFFKTIFLVIAFSLLHGIVFLPVLLTIMLPNAHQRGFAESPGQRRKAEEMQFAARKLTPRVHAAKRSSYIEDCALSIDSRTLQDVDLGNKESTH